GMLGAFMFSNDDVDKKVSVLSGGERARLALAVLLLKPINFLVLDEPTNHLDMFAKEVLKDALMDFTGTIVVVSHDRDFLANLTNKTFEFRDHKIKEYLGDVNYFLEKRQASDLREVTITSKSNKKEDKFDTRNSEEAEKEKKKLQKQLQNLEKEIEIADQACQHLEKIMSEDGFYEKSDSQVILNKYNDAKAKSEKLMTEWEALVALID
ncbi:MAG: ABC-F family ATP-binding cassette domain-containing protein, partial [Saprospiraceae bacterium]|nr:ABC-F family ATP-binding cassette domain-containing protein [Saprospiraceae bacterium]